MCITICTMDGDRIPIAVLGASGFAGGELLRLLSQHPGVDVVALGAGGSAGRALADVHPHLSGTTWTGEVLTASEPVPVAASAAAFAFCALPGGTSTRLAPALLDEGVRVVDLAGDFRLDAGAFALWNGSDHPAPSWLGKAVYGLPERLRDQIAGADLVANPGCFPTPVVLGLAPLLEAGLIEPGPIFVDGKTGLSGAGRAASETTSFAAGEESVRPYRFPRHQHTPEIERALELITGITVSVSFVPHLVPAVRGVLVTCYAHLARATSTEALSEVLADAYAAEPFVRVLAPGEMVDSKRVRGSNVCELQAVADPRTGTAIVVGAIDNLVKGAAGQAIQNFNRMAGFEETTALPAIGVYP
jgi:N-acetyl-gamma-glutamyl-phosphate reductase